jgi:hypothetical protein
MITVSAHEFARALLAGPNLPIYHFDPSRAGMDDERDTSVSAPIVEIVEPEADGAGCNGRFITIGGDYELGDEPMPVIVPAHERLWSLLLRAGVVKADGDSTWRGTASELLEHLFGSSSLEDAEKHKIEWRAPYLLGRILVALSNARPRNCHSRPQGRKRVWSLLG